ncbi:ectonucleoside triphosphate diphosphohydrolase 8 [Anguilla anguilla]|nr:ectonucleoside triphosphate diphosphohydrolase 8 [Anguilla anguilla]XP_035291863.1 ectonucleoside triphosphate diphosphohydrolase 8 [Anguilla anguilla]
MGKLTLKQRLVGTLVAAVGCTSLIALILMLVQNDTVELPPSFQYGIVFDAGSTHTALFLYKWLGKKENNTGVVSQVLVCDVEGPGISSYAHDPPAAGQSLTACLDDAKATIPIGQERDTPVYLGATAGMRLLRLQDANKADQVMEEVAKKIKKYPFDFQGARILLGTEEGAYGWITINYLLERFIKYSFEGMWLKPKEGEILGALDMGGSSTQITFRPRDPLKDPISEVQLRLYGFNYNIYSHSYLCYGKEQAMRKLQIQLLKITNMSQQVYHPCYHHGYNLTLALGDLYNSPCAEKTDAFDPANFVTFLGTSDPGQCLKLVKTIFNFSDCSFPPNCAFNGIYQPPVYGNFFAFSAYFYTFDFLGLAPQAPLPQVLSTIESFCKKDWLMVKTENPNIKDKYLLDYCASANYIMTLLQEAYKFNETTWSNIYFKKKVADTDVGWTLGYMLNLSSLIPSEHPLLMSGVKHEQWAAGVFFIVFALFLSLVVTVILCAVNINY